MTGGTAEAIDIMKFSEAIGNWVNCDDRHRWLEMLKAIL